VKRPHLVWAAVAVVAAACSSHDSSNPADTSAAAGTTVSVTSATSVAPDDDSNAGAPGAPTWVHQLGAEGSESATAVAADAAGNVFVVGETESALDGPNHGGSDAYIAKLGADGSRLWLHQFGTSQRDAAFGVATDPAGNAVVVGITFGDLGRANLGIYDAFVAEYSGDGQQRWLTQFGTAAQDLGAKVATDRDGNIYVTGDTFADLGGPHVGEADAYLVKLDPTGRQLWARQYGSPAGDGARSVAVDTAGNVVIAGQTDGAIGPTNSGNSDAFVVAYDTNGQRRWAQPIGTAALDYAIGVCTDSTGAVYIAGLTNGSLGPPNTGGADVLVAKLTASGVPEWTRTLGTGGDDQADAITVDDTGNLVIVGNTAGELVAPSAGGNDAVIVSLSPASAVRWTKQFGTPGTDAARGVTISAGRLVVVGQTNGNLDPASSAPHGVDGFIAQFEL
jgi:hypothetical protein